MGLHLLPDFLGKIWANFKYVRKIHLNGSRRSDNPRFSAVLVSRSLLVLKTSNCVNVFENTNGKFTISLIIFLKFSRIFAKNWRQMSKNLDSGNFNDFWRGWPESSEFSTLSKIKLIV